MQGFPSGDRTPSDAAEREAAATLTVGDRQKRLRRLWRSIPSPPRCKTCHRPFAGVGGPIMRLAGLGPWPGNPKYCRGCFRDLYRKRAGAEIECSLLFADVRESTAAAETMRPAEFRQLLDRFYETAFRVLVAHDAFVDKFVGDEVIGIFIPAMIDGPPALAAVEAGIELLRDTGHAAGDPWVPVGVGVNWGVAYVGAVGTADHVEFTALGDIVNVTARLSSAAGAGELLVTQEAARAAGWPALETLEHRRLQLRGRSEVTEVVVLSSGDGSIPRTTERSGT